MDVQRLGGLVDGRSSPARPARAACPRARRRAGRAPVQRLEVAAGEGVAKRVVGQDRREDREVGEREHALLPERERGLERAAGHREGGGQGGEPRRRPDADDHAGDRRRRLRREAGDVVVERGGQAVRGDPPRGGAALERAGAERDVLALGVESVAARFARELIGVDRAKQHGEHERVAPLLLLARELELDLAVRVPDDLHHRIAPQPQRLGEGQHAGDVRPALARQLAEAAPDRGDADPVRVQDGVDAQALLGPLAADLRGALELVFRGRPEVAQRGQGAADVAAHRSCERGGREPAEVRDLVADAGDDAVDHRVELGLDVGDEPADCFRHVADVTGERQLRLGGEVAGPAALVDA